MQVTPMNVEVKGKSSSADKADGETIIEVRGIRKVYAVNQTALTVFDGLSYKIGRGSFLSIIGPSGCGKSTLLKLISGLETPSGGEVFFNGRRIDGPPKGMIYVFQQYTKSIFPWRTVLQNIRFGLDSQKSLPAREAHEKCMEYVKLVGLQGYENYYPYQLSGGMQQRVVIARALICEPDVLLMDEPFSAVDAMTRAILQELILKIWSTLPITVLFVTHDVDEAVFLSNRIVSLGRAPATVREDVAIDLAYPRDQIRTRGEERFNGFRQRLFSSIFLQEKEGIPNA
ncbi:ABC transporter ATP-binding protein [Roseiarcaceae bacterium H3SJ34-1]|uniref:ABC transporter ATP-binding protein n=1 Tax=Terripilifer ovatus TaxID=3032367 RepID=UPI003AB95B6A|nr:ABC transporter ATP-binding protein [Roseiarcaceae bacterium H3SJ34-1]